ncbi:MAG: hydrogenase expression/formation protein HypC [Pseudonocardiales bacterium]|jgi:hydrogenase expression/formation protein HypC|nr:hydrogenase assembly chaperone hypC/hupF [Pseudonocardiales bacterium]MDT4965259.1 hydrogenase expression/formation protein HypC [Pseudonocardiales bacterium]MDT4970135.1 hydrogenase expression/formation protein HypC [Pseudonocardiales bacterium]PZS35663.1 MAG: HypC/HybG/HupF family hydrogenase formation chaperone [Pseudonocardiales bacterium]
MCLGIPGQVVEVTDEAGRLAKVDVNGVQRIISIRLLDGQPLEPGDWVLVHVGFAMARIDQHEADLTLAAVKQMGQSYYDEVEAFNSTAIV